MSFFDNSENETGFILERRRRGESIFTEIARLNPSAGSQSKVDYLDRGLSSAIYEYRVRAYNNLGQSSPSNISSAAPSNNGSSGAVTIRMIRYFDTWAANIIKSTDVAGITYHKPSGHLFLSDSEIEEIPSLFKGVNVFEINSLGNTVFREIQTNNIEPTGITFNEVDSYFYVSNDDQRTITRYNASFSAPLKVVSTLSNPSPANDPEDITSDPVTGQLYLVDGVGGKRQVVVYDKDINYQRSFSVADRVADGEGIAFHPISRNLFITSSPSHIYEYTTTGTFIAEYSIASFSPTPTSGMQGLTLAPSSNPNDDPQTLSLYIVDAGVDNAPDGRVYEAELVNY